MTLKEKLIYEIGDNCEHSSYCRKKSCQTENGIFCFVDKQTIENCEQIADEFAIGFAEWISYKYKYLDNKGWFATNYHLEMGIFKSSQELLEIYKKENEL